MITRLRLQTALVVVLATLSAARAPAQQDGGSMPGTPVNAGAVTVLAAASLTAAFQSLATAFEHGHPHLAVQLNVAGSSTLVQQIQQGAPADVFAAADEANMQKLAAAGALAGAPQVFVTNALQIVVRAGNPKRIANLVDLTKPGLTIALCGPTVPCGHYAAEAFEKAGVSVPPASQEVDVKAVLAKVSLGEADAGVVYVTDVQAAGNTVEGVAIPASANVVARYPIAVLKSASNPAGAAAFVAFILSPEGQRVLTSFGFISR